MQVVVPEDYRYLYEPNPDVPIVKIPDEVLRQTAAEVSRVTKKTQLLIDDMLRAMRKANGIGLAAPQMGVLQRVIVIAPHDLRPMALINPVIVKRDGSQIGQEGCLSIPGLYGDVERFAYVEVDALDRKGREITLEMEGLSARVVQHEIDHLDGVLFIDKVDVTTLHWQPPGGGDDVE